MKIERTHIFGLIKLYGCSGDGDSSVCDDCVAGAHALGVSVGGRGRVCGMYDGVRDVCVV